MKIFQKYMQKKNRTEHQQFYFGVMTNSLEGSIVQKIFKKDKLFENKFLIINKNSEKQIKNCIENININFKDKLILCGVNLE